MARVVGPALLLPMLAACAAPSAVVTPLVIATAATSAPPATATPVIPPTSTPDPLQVSIPTINPEDPVRFSFPTPIIFPTPLNWRPPVLGVPLSLRSQDHFWFARPIASDSVNWPLGSYRYGSDYFGQMNIHAGIDIDAPLGTPVLAAGPGQVVWADWGLFYFTPGREDDPYGIAVAVKHDFGYNNQVLYTLYAHLSGHNELFVGQQVNTGDVLGWIGVTGNTTGPHVHFEVRVGKNDYFSTRNPEMWVAPYSGWGILAGQLLDLNGRPIPGWPIEIYNARGRYVATVYTYGARVARPDDQWRENFAISDLPEGMYQLRASLPATDTTTAVVTGEVQVRAGQSNFVILQAGKGLVTNALPAQSMTPPFPTDTATFTPTPTHTLTPTPSHTPRPSRTPTHTRTPRPTLTQTPTRTPSPSRTPSRTP